MLQLFVNQFTNDLQQAVAFDPLAYYGSYKVFYLTAKYNVSYTMHMQVQAWVAEIGGEGPLPLLHLWPLHRNVILQ